MINDSELHGLPENHREIVRSFPKLIEPMVHTILEADEVKQHPCALAMASIAAGRDVLAELWDPAFAAAALLAALDALRQEFPEAVTRAADASAGQTSTAGLQ